MDTSRYYFAVSEVRAELEQRQALRPVVEAWWLTNGWGLPPYFVTNPSLVGAICRQMATARYEDVVFACLAREAGLTPIWLEYLADNFSDKNSYKRSLLQRHICRGRGRNGGLRLGRERLANTAVCNGQTLGDIKVAEGLYLTEYHHRLQDVIIPGAVRFDISPWLKAIGNGRANDYYAASLSLWVAHGVLFEDYHGGESGQELDGFTTQVFEPAWRKVVETFGVRPLIVPLPWQTEFAYYPADASAECMRVVGCD